MYIETSYPRQLGDYANLNSPKLQFNGNTCLQFYYHMYGAAMGTLNVSINGNSVFSASGDKGDKWWEATIDVNLSGKYAVRDFTCFVFYTYEACMFSLATVQF